MAYLAIMQKKRKIPHRVELLCDIVGRQSASVPTLAFFFDDTTPNSIENVESAFPFSGINERLFQIERMPLACQWRKRQLANKKPITLMD